MLYMMHLGERLHGSDDLSTGHLLIEGVDKAVGAYAVVSSNSEGMEPRFKSVCLRAEGQAPRHTKLRRM